MHMADALVSGAVAGTMYLSSAAALGYSIKKINSSEDISKKIPVMGVMGAFVFAAQMINFTIPGTGSSGHLAGGMMISAILGPYAGFVTMVSVLILQCLLFADGGLLALGCNIWNMAFYGCFIGSFLIWKNIMKNNVSKKKIWIASILGSVITLQMGAFSVVLETTASNITELPFSIFVATMQPIHLAIGLVEGCITALVLTFVYEARPELLWRVNVKEHKSKFSKKKTLGILFGIAVVIGGIVSIFASTFPDGLEWSIARVYKQGEIVTNDFIHNLANKIQSFTAILPDYNLKNSEAISGTSLSGIVGAVVLFAGCIIISKVIKNKSKKKRNL